jgi:hypothetical protein
VTSLAQFVQYAAPFFGPIDVTSEAAREYAREVRNADTDRFAHALHARLSADSPTEWRAETRDLLDACVVEAASDARVPADVARKALRYLLTGERIGAPLVLTMLVLRRDWVLERLLAPTVQYN